jgi:hypothetical protein
MSSTWPWSWLAPELRRRANSADECVWDRADLRRKDAPRTAEGTGSATAPHDSTKWSGEGRVADGDAAGFGPFHRLW